MSREYSLYCVDCGSATKFDQFSLREIEEIIEHRRILSAMFRLSLSDELGAYIGCPLRTVVEFLPSHMGHDLLARDSDTGEVLGEL